VFPAPAYQNASVNAYLQALDSNYTGLFNSSGRGFPDVSAYGTNISIFLNGNFKLTAGTSASTPMFAAMIALLNDRLVSAGQPPLGFLNPLLYSKNTTALGAFHDNTNGTNPGCGTPGFSAIAGWDPVTGLGSPNFSNLLKAANVPA
jgi:tripeptidyl-peptidase-1